MAYKIKNPTNTVALWRLSAAIKTLPLVRRIAAEIVEVATERATSAKSIVRTKPKAQLTWEERKAIFSAEDAVQLLDKKIEDCESELQNVGIEIINKASGRVGFPTIVNNKLAYFSWEPGNDTIIYWHYANDEKLRPIPPDWYKQ